MKPKNISITVSKPEFWKDVSMWIYFSGGVCDYWQNEHMVTPMSLLVTIIITHSMTGERLHGTLALKLEKVQYNWNEITGLGTTVTTGYNELVKSDILTSYFSKIHYKIIQKQMQKLKNLNPLYAGTYLQQMKLNIDYRNIYMVMVKTKTAYNLLCKPADINPSHSSWY